MKLFFTGQKRMVYRHEHPVTPAVGKRSKPIDPIEWSSATVACGTVDNLELTGNFRVEFEFSESELRNWLRTYVQECPDKGLELVSEMQAKAIIHLTKEEGGQ